MASIRRRFSSSEDGGFVSSLKQFDAYAKPMDDFRIKTTSGAAGTLLISSRNPFKLSFSHHHIEHYHHVFNPQRVCRLDGQQYGSLVDCRYLAKGKDEYSCQYYISEYPVCE